jgi:hypothetical protein
MRFAHKPRFYTRQFHATATQTTEGKKESLQAPKKNFADFSQKTGTS